MASGVTREAVYQALLAQLGTAGATFKTYSRRWRSVWDDVQARVPDLPMLVQWENDEEVLWTNRGIGRVCTWRVKLEIYAKIPDGQTPGVPNSTTGGSQVLNPLLDAIDVALAPDPTDPDGVQTLGGLVTDCRVEGNIIKVLGDEDPSGQCGAIVPITILVPYGRTP